MNIESVTKREEREYFKEYAEDYNTNTLPGEKFYNLDRWAVAEAARRAAISRAAACAKVSRRCAGGRGGAAADGGASATRMATK